MDDDAARLACYDVRNPPHKSVARAQNGPGARAATSSAPATSTQPAPSSAPSAAVAAPGSPTPSSAAPAPPRPTTPDENFGLAEQRAAKAIAAEPTELTARVNSVSARLSGELLLKLDNGQSWIQAQRKAGVHIKAGERVTISRGALGAYLLSSDSGATMRVRRLQ